MAGLCGRSLCSQTLKIMTGLCGRSLCSQTRKIMAGLCGRLLCSQTQDYDRFVREVIVFTDT